LRTNYSQLKKRKVICGDEWNSTKLTDANRKNWISFLRSIDLYDDKNTRAKANVSYLLDFIGYK